MVAVKYIGTVAGTFRVVYDHTHKIFRCFLHSILSQRSLCVCMHDACAARNKHLNISVIHIIFAFHVLLLRSDCEK